MKLFLHIGDHIRIVNDTSGWQEWQGTQAEFLALEPGYPGLPEGMTIRYQTPEKQYVSDGEDLEADAFNALPYCENLSSYPAWTPPVPDSPINDTVTALTSTWSSTKIDSEIAAAGGGTSLPVGVALIWFAAAAPAGWYLADGSDVDEDLPIGIWALSIGMVSNGDGTVPLPDMRLRVPMMAGTGFALMETGGEPSVALAGVNNGPHTHPVTLYKTLVTLASGGYATGWHLTLTGNTGTSGLGTPHNNLQPYFIVNVIIYGGNM